MDVTLVAVTWVIAGLTTIVVGFVLSLIWQRAAQISRKRRLSRVIRNHQGLVDGVRDGSVEIQSVPFEARPGDIVWEGMDIMLREALASASPAQVDRLCGFADQVGYAVYYRRQLVSGDRWQRAIAASRLADYCSHEVAGDLLVASGDPDRRVRTAAVRALGRLRDGGSLAGLAELLEPTAEGGDTLSLRVLAGSLSRYGTRAVNVLAPLLSHPSWRVRGTALTILGEVGGGSHIPTIISCLTDPETDVRAKAARALCGLHPHSALFPLLGSLEDGAWLVRMHALRALAAIGSEQAIGAMARCLTDSHWRVRQEAAAGLAGMGTGALTALTQVLLTSRDRFAREQVVEELQRTVVITDAIERLARYPEGEGMDGPEVALLTAVAEVGALSIMINALQAHANPQVRMLLVRVLALQMESRVVAALVRAEAHDIDPMVRHQAAAQLKSRQPDAEVA